MMIKLQAADAHLILETKDEMWCRVSLVTPHHNRVLGHENLQVLARKLCSYLSDPGAGPVVGKINGKEVRNILNFTDPHTSFYGHHDGQNVFILIQDHTLEIIGELSLNGNTTKEWIELLRRTTMVT